MELEMLAQIADEAVVTRAKQELDNGYFWWGYDPEYEGIVYLSKMSGRCVLVLYFEDKRAIDLEISEYFYE